ncbi:nitrous oxide reductase accessory protein NosL [bacterium]|nr:nitrous oxide reductase accessory protein NosL [bacterium]
MNKPVESTPPVGIKHEELEFYEEPPRMSAKDMLGVVVALVLLAVIGTTGYYWLTPGKVPSDLLAFTRTPAAGAHEAGMAATTASAAERLRCDYCGMFADASASYIQAHWLDGTTGNFDSWDCLFSEIQAGQRLPERIQVVAYAKQQQALSAGVLLDAEDAYYRYGTAPVHGSMPPYVAAFADRATAEAAAAELGGELVDYQGLAAKWELTTTAPAALETPEHDQPVEHNALAVPEAVNEETVTNPSAGGEAMPIEDEPLAGLHDHDQTCPYCGMLADKSASHVIASWSDGAHTHHDSWDCAIYYGQDEDLSMANAEVLAYGSPQDKPRWLDAAESWFLYDTKPVTGSMPPYVAAFDSRAAAEAAQPELGGEVTDFAGLQAKWD